MSRKPRKQPTKPNSHQVSMKLGNVTRPKNEHRGDEDLEVKHRQAEAIVAKVRARIWGAEA